jgi:Arc/MetJ family transcription regulator
MRTNIEFDDKLTKAAMPRAKTKTKRETVEAGLPILVRLDRQTGTANFAAR